MPTWLIVVAVIVILVAAFALSARQPSDLERLGQEVAELVKEEKFAEALPVAEEAVDVARKEFDDWSGNLGSHHSNLMVTGWLADALMQLGEVHWELGSKDKAEVCFRQAVSVLESAITVNDPLHESEEPMPPHPDLPVALSQLALTLAETGYHEQAVSSYRRSIEVSDEISEEGSPVVVGTLVSLANSLDHLGRTEEAEAALLRAIGLIEPFTDESPVFAFGLVAALNNLGQMYKRQGRSEDSAELLERALQIGVRELGEDHPILEPIRGSIDEADESLPRSRPATGLGESSPDPEPV